MLEVSYTPGRRDYHPFVEVLRVVRSSSAAIPDGFTHGNACVIHKVNLGAILDGPSGLLKLPIDEEASSCLWIHPICHGYTLMSAGDTEKDPRNHDSDQ